LTSLVHTEKLNLTIFTLLLILLFHLIYHKHKEKNEAFYNIFC